MYTVSYKNSTEPTETWKLFLQQKINKTEILKLQARVEKIMKNMHSNYKQN